MTAPSQAERSDATWTIHNTFGLSSTRSVLSVSTGRVMRVGKFHLVFWPAVGAGPERSGDSRTCRSFTAKKRETVAN